MSTPSHDAMRVPQRDRTVAALAYVLGVLTGPLGPLVLWLVMRGRSRFIAFHAMQAALLHVPIMVGCALSLFLMYFLIGFVTGPVFFLLGLAFSVAGGVAASKGSRFEIPVICEVALRLAGP